MSQPQQDPPPDLIGRVVAAFSSVKLTVALIAVIAVISFLGTTSREFVLPLSGQRALHLDCTDVYHTTVYRVLLGLLFTNLLVCSVNSLPAAIRRYRQDGAAVAPPPPREPDHLIHLKSGELESALAGAEAAAFGRTGVRREQELAGNKSLVSFHATGRLSLLGPQVTHLGILLIIVGGLLASVATFEAEVILGPGQESDIAYSKIKVPKPGRPTGLIYLSAAEPDADPESEDDQGKYIYQKSKRRLPFTLRCNDFTVTFYPQSDMAKDYLADLSIIKDGREQARRKIEVNRPLSFGGYDVYQASFTPDLKFRLVAAYAGPERSAPAAGDRAAPVLKPGDTVAAVLSEMEPWTVPGDTVAYVVADYAPAMSGMGKDLGPTLTVGRMVGDSVSSFRLFERYPKFDAMRKDRYLLSYTAINRGWRTGLEIVHDPGLPLTYAGFVLLVLGVVQSLAVPHRRYWLVAERKGQGTDVKLIGRTRKSKAIFERRLQQMAASIDAAARGRQG
jgi:cytochrome c biogenesis protein